VLSASIDPWIDQSHRPKGRFVRLREPAPNMDFPIELDKFLINSSHGFEQIMMGFTLGEIIMPQTPLTSFFWRKHN